MTGLWLLIIVIAFMLWWCTKCSRDNFSGDFGLWRYGYPYSYSGTWYRPQGYWGPGYYGDPYGFGDFGYGGKQQMYTCDKGCMQRYKNKEDIHKCLELCRAHAPYYRYDESV